MILKYLLQLHESIIEFRIRMYGEIQGSCKNIAGFRCFSLRWYLTTLHHYLTKPNRNTSSALSSYCLLILSYKQLFCETSKWAVYIFLSYRSLFRMNVYNLFRSSYVVCIDKTLKIYSIVCRFYMLHCILHLGLAISSQRNVKNSQLSKQMILWPSAACIDITDLFVVLFSTL